MGSWLETPQRVSPNTECVALACTLEIDGKTLLQKALYILIAQPREKEARTEL